MEHYEDIIETPDAAEPFDAAGRLPLERVLLPESFATEPGLIDFRQLFGNNLPVEVEIGSGKGTFLVQRARTRPEANFLGIEWARAFCKYAADRMCRWGLQNVRMLRADAEIVFAHRIPDNSLQRLHIYFPDPWPKSRYLRRRLIKPGFVALAHRKLRIGGQLAVVTDHMHYARQMAWVILNQPGFATAPFPRTGETERVGTNFERKYIAQGRQFFSLAVMKWR